MSTNLTPEMLSFNRAIERYNKSSLNSMGVNFLKKVTDARSYEKMVQDIHNRSKLVDIGNLYAVQHNQAVESMLYAMLPVFDNLKEYVGAPCTLQIKRKTVFANTKPLIDELPKPGEYRPYVVLEEPAERFFQIDGIDRRAWKHQTSTVTLRQAFQTTNQYEEYLRAKLWQFEVDRKRYNNAFIIGLFSYVYGATYQRQETGSSTPKMVTVTKDDTMFAKTFEYDFKAKKDDFNLMMIDWVNHVNQLIRDMTDYTNIYNVGGVEMATRKSDLRLMLSKEIYSLYLQASKINNKEIELPVNQFTIIDRFQTQEPLVENDKVKFACLFDITGHDYSPIVRDTEFVPFPMTEIVQTKITEHFRYGFFQCQNAVDFVLKGVSVKSDIPS